MFGDLNVRYRFQDVNVRFMIDQYHIFEDTFLNFEMQYVM